MAQPAYSRGQLMALAAADARKYGLGDWFSRQIGTESSFNPAAVSPAGAEGIAQIVPKYHPGVDPMDPVAALDYAAKYDRQLVDKYGGNVAQALSVYNSGSPNAYKDPGFAGGETANYVRKILGGTSPAAPSPATMGVPAAAPTVAPMSVPAPRPVNLTPLLSAASGSGDYTDLWAKIGAALANRASAAAPPVASLPAATGTPLPVQPLPAEKGASAPVLPFVGASTQGVKPTLLAAVTQAAKAAGATEIRVTSGERSPSHNATVGGVSHSNHLTGDALDGYGLVNGQWVPLGQLLARTAGRYGLRSGDQPGFFNGHPDPVHVDDGANQVRRPR